MASKAKEAAAVPKVLEPPPYKSGYAASGTGAVGSGRSRLSVPDEAGAHVFSNSGFTALEDPNAALSAGAHLNVMQSQLYAEAEATEAIGVGLEPVEKQNKVYIRHEQPGMNHKFRVLSYNKLCMYFINHVDGAARMEHKEKRCCHPQKYAPEPGDGEYSETVMDSKGKEMVILRRFEAISHRCSPCWRFCCPFCWCCGRCAACWRQEMVAEVDMPAGTRIATISYDTRAGQRSPVLKVITVKDSVGYSVLFPKKEVKLAPGSGPAFQLFRDGSRSPIGRIQRMIDVNSGKYQAEVTFPVCDVSGQNQASQTMTERGVLLAVVIFLEMELPPVMA